MKKILVFLLFILFWSCGVNRNLTQKKSIEPTNEELIVFHQYKAIHRSGRIIISEENKVERPGKIKDGQSGLNFFNNPLEYTFIDSKGDTIRRSYIEHPLIKEYEYADDKGNLSRITSIEDSAIFTIRYNKIKNLDEVRFYYESSDSLKINQQLKISK